MKSVLLFPLCAVLISVLAAVCPDLLVPMQPAIVPLLGIVMFGMGITLSAEDFLYVLKRPGVLFLGLVLQFLCMPLFAWFYSEMLQLPVILMTGLVLVGACPGGTASNVICYLAKGDVALSIAMTATSTVLAIFCTPYLTWLYVGQKIEVPVLAMIISIFKIIIVPVFLGVLLNRFAGQKLVQVKKSFPLISMAAIVVIIGIIVAMNQARLQSLVLPVVLAVVLHNVSGLVAGYTLTSLAGYDQKTARTIAIEVGMQNSGLGVALASKFFPAAATLPGAIFSIWHNLSGAMVAGYWSAGKNDTKNGT